jgi:hypothetical protein
MLRIAIEFIFFVSSAGILFNDGFRRNRIAVLIAGAIGILSSYFLAESIWNRFSISESRQVADERQNSNQSQPRESSNGESPAESTCVPDSKLRREMIAKISYSVTRDAEYLKFVDDVIECKTFHSAIVIASNISYSTMRDGAYSKIAAKAIEAKDFASAADAIDLISYTNGPKE